MQNVLKMFMVNVFMIGITCLSSVASADSVGGIRPGQDFQSEVVSVYGQPSGKISADKFEDAVGIKASSSLTRYYYKDLGLIVSVNSAGSVEVVSFINKNRVLDNTGLGLGRYKGDFAKQYGIPIISSASAKHDGEILVFKDTFDQTYNPAVEAGNGNYIYVYFYGEESLHSSMHSIAVTVTNDKWPATGYNNYTIKYATEY